MTRLRFEAFEFDSETGELWKDGELVALRPQPAEVLALLVRRPGELVTREELQQRLWPDTLVEFDQGLNSCIKQIRAALGDDASSPRFVQTLPRRGYRFVHPVQEIEQPSAMSSDTSASESTAVRRRGAELVALAFAIAVLVWIVAVQGRGRPAVGGEGRTRIAVLPFETPSDTTGGIDYGIALADAVTEELTGLDPRRLDVIGQASAKRLHDLDAPLARVGERLGVEVVLRGSIERNGEGAQVYAELARSADGAVLWSRSYDPPIGDIVVGGSVAREIAREAAAELLTIRSLGQAEAATIAEAARVPYLKGRYFLRQESPDHWEKSVPLLREAVAIDPDYAPAWAALAQARLKVGAREPAREAADRALALDESQAEAHLVRGFAELFFDVDLDEARTHLERALMLAPGKAETHSAYAIYLLIVGEEQRAMREIDRALELDPVSAMVTCHVGLVYYWARRYEDAVQRCREHAELVQQISTGDYCILYAYLGLQRLPEARQQAQAILEQEEADRATIERVRAGTPEEGVRAFHEWRRNRFLQAAAEEPERPYAYFLALTYADLGDRERALEQVERAIRERDGCVPCFLIEPRFDLLRDDPRFRRMMADIRAD